MKRALAMGRARLSANADDVPPAPTDGASLRILDGCSSSLESMCRASVAVRMMQLCMPLLAVFLCGCVHGAAKRFFRGCA